MLTFIEVFVNRRGTGFYDRQERFPHSPRLNYPLKWSKKNRKRVPLRRKNSPTQLDRKNNIISEENPLRFHADLFDQVKQKLVA